MTDWLLYALGRRAGNNLEEPHTLQFLQPSGFGGLLRTGGYDRLHKPSTLVGVSRGCEEGEAGEREGGGERE